MPLYEYHCSDCENKFETLVLSSADEIACPKCNSSRLEKLFSTFGVKSESSFSEPSVPADAGHGCMPMGCGCGVRH